IENYWPDFRIQDGKPSSVTDRPNNPAVLITIRGRGVPATETASNPHGAGTEFNATGGPPAMPASGADALNHLTLFVADDGEITVPTSPRETMIAYGWKIVALPIGLELLDFEVQRNEGNDSPAGFKSTLRVVTAEGETATGSCWMNNPFSFPGAWWRTCTGL